MLTDVVFEDVRWQDMGFETLAEMAAVATLVYLDMAPEDFEISVLACDDTRICDLNGDFRAKPQPTNVLSWPSDERGVAHDGDIPAPPTVSFPGMPEELGDIAIAFETCEREALAANKPMADHVRHLVVHGVLHLLGYDHIRDLDATLMERYEVEILGKLGVSDPYREIDRG